MMSCFCPVGMSYCIGIAHSVTENCIDGGNDTDWCALKSQNSSHMEDLSLYPIQSHIR